MGLTTVMLGRLWSLKRDSAWPTISFLLFMRRMTFPLNLPLFPRSRGLWCSAFPNQIFRLRGCILDGVSWMVLSLWRALDHPLGFKFVMASFVSPPSMRTLESVRKKREVYAWKERGKKSQGKYDQRSDQIPRRNAWLTAYVKELPMVLLSRVSHGPSLLCLSCQS